MSKSIELSTAGIILRYAVETTEGTRPTSGYIKIPNVVELPDLSGKPDTLDVSDLSDIEWKRYILGLKDTGGAMGIKVNQTTEFTIAWENLCTAAKTAKASDKGVWFEYFIPNHPSFFFRGEPATLGFGGATVNSVLQNTVYITPNLIDGFKEPSTDTGE